MATTFGTQSVWVPEVSAALKARLTAGAGVGLARDLIFLSLVDVRTLVRNPPADQFLAYQPLGLPVNRGVVAGAGAAYTQFDSTWLFNVCSRLGTDQQFRSAEFVENASRGLAKRVQMICTALQVEDLAATAGAASPLVEPMRLADVTFHDREPAPGWGWAAVTWSIKFRTDLSGG